VSLKESDRKERDFRERGHFVLIDSDSVSEPAVERILIILEAEHIQCHPFKSGISVAKKFMNQFTFQF
jgi:hypothetical protein